MRMTQIIPMLPVRSLRVSVEFYRKLGFTVESTAADWRWAMLTFSDCRVMLDESINAHPASARDSVLYLYPEDIREYHASVRAAGLTIPELDVTFYGMTEFRIDDPDGNRLWIGQKV